MDQLAILALIIGGACVLFYLKFFRGDTKSREVVQKLIDRTQDGSIKWTIENDMSGGEYYFGVDEGKNLHLHMNVSTGTFTHDYRFIHIYIRQDGLPVFGTKLGHIAIAPVSLLKKLEDLAIEQTGSRVVFTDVTDEENMKETADYLEKCSPDDNFLKQFQLSQTSPFFRAGTDEDETIN